MEKRRAESAMREFFSLGRLEPSLYKIAHNHDEI